MLAARPCWLLSPLVVASALPPAELFDVVVVEDAGRLDPAHVVSAFARAKQVLLVGDSVQLQPRPFTTSVPRPGVMVPLRPAGPSLLDLLGGGLESLELDTHYRSFDERLVDFADDHFYDGRLRALPGAGSAGSQAVRLVLVDPGRTRMPTPRRVVVRTSPTVRCPTCATSRPRRSSISSCSTP